MWDGLTVLRLVRQEPWGERGVQVGSFDGEEKVRGDGDTWSHVFVNEGLVFKLLPLGRSEGEPVPSIHHQAEGMGKNRKNVKSKKESKSTKADEW